VATGGFASVAEAPPMTKIADVRTRKENPMIAKPATDGNVARIVEKDFGTGRGDGGKARGNKLGNIEDRVALDFARQHGDSFRYVALWNRWMRFEADRWQHEETLGAFDHARRLCREAGDAKARTVAAVVTLARTDRAIAATEVQWDLDETIFNIPTKEQR
jgi:putative DNA primase/helicase